jgi:carboxypeptidase C (cathepsin A)
MKTKMRNGLAPTLAVAMAVAAFSAQAQQPARGEGRGAVAPAEAAQGSMDAARPDRPVPPPKSFVTHHTTTVRGQKIAYTATAGETYLSDLQGDPTASIFSFAYVKDGPVDPKRPVIFVFNGGPGSSSVWLHMGILGPKRVVLDKEVNPSNLPPFGLKDNPYSLLDIADLVFIDPVGTGYSQSLGRARNEDFYGVDEDAASVAQFMELWLAKNGRFASPKFVIGESYGSVRAAVLPRALMGGPVYGGVMRGITLNGVVLLGTTIGGSLGGAPEPKNYDGPEMRTALSLPALADTAWYHNKIDRKGRSLQAYDQEVTTFARTDYFNALKKASANTLSDEERTAMAARLMSYTGLPAATFDKDLKVQLQPMANHLLSERGLSVGAYDSRYTLPSAHSFNEPVTDDPAMTLYVPGFVAAFQQMLHDDLKVNMERPYGSIVWSGLNSKWNWKRTGTPEGLAYADELVTSMRRTPGMHLLVASGYYDLVTTPASARYQLEKADPPKDRTEFKAYESGHMLYLGDTAQSFSDDVRKLVLTASR